MKHIVKPLQYWNERTVVINGAICYIKKNAINLTTIKLMLLTTNATEKLRTRHQHEQPNTCIMLHFIKHNSTCHHPGTQLNCISTDDDWQKADIHVSS